MAKGKFTFTGISQIELDFEKGSLTSTLTACNTRLEVSNNQDQSVFFDGNKNMRKAAWKPLTQTFIQGLIVNVKNAHAKNWMPEAEHMKYIMDELGRAFAHPTDDPIESTMDA